MSKDKRPVCNCPAPTINYGRQFPHHYDWQCRALEPDAPEWNMPDDCAAWHDKSADMSDEEYEQHIGATK